MRTTKKTKGRFKVGDWVAFDFGTRRVFAQVIEERGPIGINGRHLCGIRLERDSTEPDEFELPEDDLEPAGLPDKAAVLNYFKEGGLVAILRSHLGDRKEQPRVWLTYTPRGEVTYTLAAERGVLGGVKVPYFALHEDHVFGRKKEEVLTFLTNFGLSRRDAEEVVATVGTAP